MATTSPSRPADSLPQPSVEELREQLGEQVDQLEVAADHVEQLPHAERPRIARRLVRRLRGCADRASAALDDPATTIEQLEDACIDAMRCQLECSAYLVRDGVRRVLTPEQFDEVDDSAVLVGELAKAAFGGYVDHLREGFTGRRRMEFDMNPLHAFTPVIAAGHAWARRTLTATDQDRCELVRALRTGILDVFCGERRPNLMVTPTTHMTSDALNLFFVAWGVRQDQELMERFDEACDQAVAALDGCGISADLLGVWFGIGVASAILRLRLDSAGADRLDTADATRIMLVLDPDPDAAQRPSRMRLR